MRDEGITPSLRILAGETVMSTIVEPFPPGVCPPSTTPSILPSS
jgi:hypothetical protein